MAEILMRVKKMAITIQEGSNVFNRKMLKKKYNKEKGGKNKMGNIEKEKEAEQNGREKEVKVVITNRKRNLPGKRTKENTKREGKIRRERKFKGREKKMKN